MYLNVLMFVSSSVSVLIPVSLTDCILYLIIVTVLNYICFNLEGLWEDYF